MTATEELADVIALLVHEATAPLKARIAVLEARPVIAGPPGPAGERGERGEPGAAGRDGLDGKDGIPGRDGIDGAAGVDGKDGAIGLCGKDGAAGAQGEPGRDGRDGKDGADGLHGKDGTPGRDGKDGAAGLNGKDVDMSAVLSAASIQIRAAIEALPRPKDGTDGKDGLGFDDVDLSLDEARGWVLRLAQGERVKEWELGIPHDRKVWEAGKTYPKGSGVTWDGHYWMALESTTEPPGEGCPDWRLVVRRGKQGRQGERGKDGAAGRDLTQFDPATGQKW